MNYLRCGFSKSIVRDLKFLQSNRGNQADSLKVKEFLIEGIRSNNWYQCYKVPRHMNLFRVYREFWIDIIKDLQKAINSFSTFSKKDCFYILKFLRSINYELDPINDRVFILKIQPLLSAQSVILVFPYLTIPKQNLQVDFERLEADILKVISQAGQTRSRFLSSVIQNGLQMEYWSPQFIGALSAVNLAVKSRRVNSMIEFMNTKMTIEEGYIHKEPSKLQLIFGEYLLQFGYNFESNVKIGLYEVDFLIGNKIIVQLNGNHHYCTNDFSKHCRRDQFKKKLLQKSGYLVVYIDINEWIMMVRRNKRTDIEEKFLFTSKLIEQKYIQYLEQLQ